VDKKIAGRTSHEISGLEEGNYWWTVTAIDAKGAESQPSQASRLSLVQELTGNQAYLEITRIIQHGRVVEVQGKTEPGSTVIVNNEQVFSISPDGTFRHFTSPLAHSGSQGQHEYYPQNRRDRMIVPSARHPDHARQEF
jgi:hypothetical protein